MEYLRPKTIDEALALLKKGIPLGGGTQVTPRREGIACVIDLQSLGLDEISLRKGTVNAGAMTRLQQLISLNTGLPEALRQACRHEAAWNIRNQATLGGVMMSADGRSPLLTAFAALGTEIEIAPGNGRVKLPQFLEERHMNTGEILVLKVAFEVPEAMAYEYVARAPMDRPIVCVAGACRIREGEKILQVGLGGYGGEPASFTFKIGASNQRDLLEQVSQKAFKSYQSAGDAFASGEYRSEIAGVLARRVTGEVLAVC